MAAVHELIPLKRIEGASFEQPPDSVADVSEYMEAFIMYTIVQIDRNSATTTVYVQTAIDNRDESYVTVASMDYTSDPSPLPHNQIFYLAGSSTGSSSAPGFGRYLRIRVDQNAAASVTLQAKAVLKP
jgi:hypothetical protein